MAFEAIFLLTYFNKKVISMSGFNYRALANCEIVGRGPGTLSDSPICWAVEDFEFMATDNAAHIKYSDILMVN